jgi:hypothetical protein
MIKKDSEDFFRGTQTFLLNVAVDNVIFGYHDKELKVLLQQPYTVDKWTVTGGYIKRNESIQAAAARVAFERTGLKGLYLQQFQAFGNPERVVDSGFTAEHVSEVTGFNIAPDSWIFDYFVSVAFYTLTEFSKVNISKADFEAECQWWPVNQLPPMMFDHALIVREALKALKLHIAHYPIGYELLEEKFTLPELHSLYETILGKQLDDRNFKKKFLATGIITRLNEKRQISGHRPPTLYKFDKEKYDEGLLSGVELVF